MEDNLVTLKVGGDVPVQAVTAIMLTLKDLFNKHPILAYELVSVCRNPSHLFWGNARAELTNWGCLESDGQPHDVLRDIVLSAVKGDGFEMTLGSPIKAKE